MNMSTHSNHLTHTGPQTTPQFTSVLHILAERAEWKQLVHYLHTLRTSTTTNSSELHRLLLTTEGPHGWTPLMLSCARAPASVIQLLLQCCPESARIADRSGMFPLHFVSSWGEQQEAKAASLPPSSPRDLEIGIDLDLRGGTVAVPGADAIADITAHATVAINDEKSAENDYNNEGDDRKSSTVTGSGGHHNIALKDMHLSGDYELKRVLQLLLEHGPEILALQNQWGQTPLHCVFDNEDRDISPNIETIRILLGIHGNDTDASAHVHAHKNTTRRQTHTNTNSKSDEGNDVGESSSSSDEDNAVRRYALQALSTPDTTNSYLPLHLAASRGVSEDILNLLVEEYPMAAMTATTSGDLPIHLLQYHAEDEVNMWASDHMMRQGSWRGGSGIFRLRKSHTFNIINLKQVESLLRPLCIIGEQGSAHTRTTKGSRSKRIRHKRTTASAGVATSSTNADEQRKNPQSKEVEADINMNEDSDEEGTPVLQSDDDNDVDTSEHDEVTASSNMEHRVALNLATRLPGSRGVNLPIHIAAEHGASFDMLKSLCETNVEGVATSQPISKSLMVSSSSSLDTSEARYRSPEIFPIEVFEKGRAGMEALKASHLLQCHLPSTVVCSSNSLTRALHTTQIEGATEMMNIQILKAVLQSFEERSDLLFAFYPEAMPAQFRETRRNRNAPKPRLIYRKDQTRMYRLERLIRSEALDMSTDEFSVTARRVWLWMYRGINSRDNAVSAEYQGAVGRIITGLPTEALLKLSFISHIANDMGIDLGNDIENLRGVPCMVQGKSIIQYAAVRDASMTMDAMLFLNENEKRNVINNICECLDAHDALAFSSVCRQTVRAGVRLFPENKLKESGRSWLLPPREKLTWPSQAEFWQHLDSMLMMPNSTHTIFVTYYLEVSDSSQRSYSESGENEGVSFPPQHMNGGLIVVGESATSSSATQKNEGHIVGKFQKKIAHSEIASISGYEVQVSFKYQPNLSYSLRVYGPKGGGRVSISNARVRQVIHCLDGEKRSPLQVLLMNKQDYSYSPLADQISTLLDEKYRFAGIDSSHLLHFALENKVSTEVLEALIDSNPSLLLETDGRGRTPLHTLFLLSRDESPSLGTVKLLLRTPGENATKLKDKDYKVPLHIAAEQGVSNSVLELLVEAYPDGCYRQTKDGDIPVHLLVRSGKASKASVEMLLRPIMESETICSMAGSQGDELPLHIAAEYNCSYNIIERLLFAYEAAATIPRRRPGSNEVMYALDIFESNRSEVFGTFASPEKSFRSWDRGSSRTLGDESLARIVEEAAHLDIQEADFNLRSDLIFVHFPVTPKPYRKESDRIKRLRNMIKREAYECVERRELDGESTMSNMAQFAWCFLCTFENPDDPVDHYADEVGNILSSLTIPVVKLLASISNPFSTPPHMALSECATPRCKNLISSRVLFVGRYVFDESQLVLHQSDDSFVVAGRDYGAVEAYKRLLKTFKREELPDIDDLASVDSGSIVHVLSFTDDTASYFVDFAMKIGLDEDFARREFDSLLSPPKGTDEMSDSRSDEKKELTMELFREFCDAHNVDSNGVRKVAMKFMKHRTQFLREKVTRARLDLSKSDWFVFPVIEDYDIDRADTSGSESIEDISPSNSWELSDSKDKFFSVDLQEMNSLGYDFTSFKYALVLPRGDKDLNDMVIHGELGTREIRDLLLKVGKAVKALHCREVVHGNLILSNIVQFGSHVALIDLDSATLCKKNDFVSMLSDKIAGVSQRFATAAMPPELIAQIDLVGNPNALHKYEQYWKHVRKDAGEIDSLSSDDIHVISNIIRLLHDQVQAFQSNQDASNVFRISIQDTNIENPEIGWKQKVSDTLEGIGFDDLPSSLSKCEDLAEFRDTWSRLKSNALLWERIRPQFGDDKKYAYVVKYHDDMTARHNSEDQLPYELVSSSHKIDVWAFGVMLFSLCTRSSLFHQTLDGNLHGAEAYSKLYNWSQTDAKSVVRKFIKNPLAQDLLLKILVREEDRLPSIDAVLTHPFFGRSTSPAAQKIIQDSLDTETLFPDIINIKSLLEQTEAPPNPKTFNTFSIEKFCRIIFDRLGDIKIPTGLIILPYKLRWNSRRQMLEPPDQVSADSAEQIGQYLLDINTTTAKLSFWLRVKENLAEQNGAEFKSKIINWIQRAKKEDTSLIAKEIVSAINADEAYKGICIEMLEEEMSISHARTFIRDPIKAAMMLIEESKIGLKKHLSSAQFLYLIDEFRGCPSLPIDYSSLASKVSDQSFYPIEVSIHEKHLENTLLPFINIAVMVATTNDGLNGLAQLLGLREAPNSWNVSSLGLVHGRTTSGRSTIVEFATLQGILRKKLNEAISPDDHRSSISQDFLSSVDELGQLELFFQQYDQLGNFSDLHQSYEEDKSLVFWTRDEDESAPLHSTPEFIATVNRLERLQDEITQKKRLEEEVNRLNTRLTELKKEAEEKIRKRNSKKIRLALSRAGTDASQKDNSTRGTLANIPKPSPPSSSTRAHETSSNCTSTRPKTSDEESKPSRVLMM